MTPLVDVLVLQHPLEVCNAKGTARLLHLSLHGSRLVTGEVFDGRLLLGAAEDDAPAPSLKYNILLYPETSAEHALGMLPLPALAPDVLRDPSQLRLIVLDGTWRKSRKMLYLNSLLQLMPRLPLQGLPASRYHLRRAQLPDQLSTLEATCAALAQLEGAVDKYQPLLNAFDGFVTQQLDLQSGHRQGVVSAQ